MLGAQDLVYEAGDVIVFELVWWDMTMQAVRETIEAVQDAGLDDYFLNQPNLYVGAALYHLGYETMLVSLLDSPYQPETEGALSQAILVRHLAGQDTTAWLEALHDVKTIAWPYATSLSVMALMTEEEAEIVHASYLDAFVTDLANRDLENLDPDTLVLTYLALLTMSGETAATLANEVLEIIIDTLHASSFGPNAATTAHQIIALTAAGLDAQDTAYHHDGVSLIEQLLSFHDEAGAFYWNDDSLTVDQAFSTPQAYLALVLYEQFMQTLQPIHPFVNGS